ncbi:MAG: maturase [PVC group bacterium]|nr:maturase [PVC group bacterium]
MLFVLDADVKSAFNKIRHAIVLKLVGNFPGKKYIEAWLKAGYVEFGKLHETLEGTPQGGVVSPLLANIALHGMEEALGIKYKIIKSGKNKGRLECISKIKFVRYADDFVVFCLTEADAEWAKARLGEFLHERGLEYSEEKTRIVDLNTGFDFLGFNIRRYKVSNTKSGYKLLIKPSKESQKKVIDKLRQSWSELKGHNVIAVLKKINPIIRGQANYYRIAVSKEIFSKWDYYMYLKQRKYVKRMHPNKSWEWRRTRYWGSLKKNSLDQWMFGNKASGAFMLKYSHFPIERHILVKGYASPDNPMEREYWEKRELRKGKIIPKYRTLVRKQGNRCPLCKDWLSNGERLELDHIIPKEKGGDDTLSNKQLLHYYCHMQKTAQERR